jgi:hypothetical protein
MIGSWEHSHPPAAIVVEIIVYRNCILVDSSMSRFLGFPSNDVQSIAF